MKSVNICIWVIYIFELFDRWLYSPEIVVNIIGGITGIETVATAAACAANAGDKTPTALAGIACDALDAVMAGSGLNYRLVYVYPGRTNA